MVKRFIGSGRLQEGGFLTTHKRSFNAHVTGGDFRHDATHIDMNQPLPNYYHVNVQGTLELLAAGISGEGGEAAESAAGFISVGNVGDDGYATGSYNVGSVETPTFEEAMLAAFDDDHLQNGGIILILSGTYVVTTTIDVPSGISIMGEISGSIIIGETTEEPMFKVLEGLDLPTIGGNSGSGDLDLLVGNPIDETRFFNLILADNLNGTIESGGLPISTMQTVPMIQAETSSRLTCESVKFIGRINQGAVSGRGKTLSAIGYTTGGAIGSHLAMRSCLFDGMKIGVDFSPGNGDIDNLTINKCRARIFGAEAAGSPNASDNCFVSMSLCNLTATDNYVVGYGTYPTQRVGTCFVISSSGGGTDVSILISGTAGSPSAGTTLTSKSVLFDETGGDLKAVVTNNNWGSDISSKWFVTVGEHSALTSDGFGDFNGSGAIDLLLSASFEYPTNVIVNPGTYEITSTAGGARYNFIGNCAGGIRPIFDMNLGGTADTDEVSHRLFLMGSEVRNIAFQSLIGTTSEYHSVRPNGGNNAKYLIVENCYFHNITLSINPVDVGETQNIDYLAIRDCVFYQDGGYDDDINILTPIFDTTIIENCKFIGNGYAGLIGWDSGFGEASPIHITAPQLTLKSCTFSLQSESLNDASPLTIDSFLVVDDFQAKIIIENCQIIVSDLLAVRTNVINASLDTSYLRHIYIKGLDISVSNSIFQGPSQTMDISGTDYPLPVVEFVPIASLHINDSRFLDNVTQIGHTNDAFESTSADSITITNSEFANRGTTFGGTPVSQVLLDIDVDPTSGAKQSNSDIYILISGNAFRSEYSSGSTSHAVHHTAITSAAREAEGVVQIYARDFNVTITDNKILGVTSGFETAGSLAHSSGIVVNNFDDTATSDSEVICPIIVANNQIAVENVYSTGSTANSATALYLKGTDFVVTGNHLNMRNASFVASSMIGVAVFDNKDTVTGTPAPAMITGNVFSNNGQSGVEAVANWAWIQNTSTTEGIGYITDNVFSAPAGDGYVPAFRNNNNDVFWVVERNRNQIETQELTGATGKFAINDNYVGGAQVSTKSIGVENPMLAGKLCTLYYSLDVDVTYHWLIDCRQALPQNVKILSIDLIHDGDANVGSAAKSDLFLELGSQNTGVIVSGTPGTGEITTGEVTTTLENNIDFANVYNTSINALQIMVDVTLSHGSLSMVVDFLDFKITYMW